MRGETSQSTFHHVHHSELSLGNESSLAESDQLSAPVALPAEPHTLVTGSSFSLCPVLCMLFAALHPFTSPPVHWVVEVYLSFSSPWGHVSKFSLARGPGWSKTQKENPQERLQRSLFQSHTCRTKAGAFQVKEQQS